MCIPKTSKNTEGAMKFIDFMCSTEIAYDNVSYIEYSTPHTEALEKLGDEYKNNTIYNPSADVLKNCTSFSYLEPKVQEEYNKAWESVRLQSNDSSSLWIIIVIAAVIVVAVVAFVIYKKKVNKIKYE